MNVLSAVKILNTQVVEYIFAHSVAQTPCYSNATSSNDYATRTIHDFYRARVSSEIDEFAIIENGLKLFNIGTSLKVIPFLGDSYRVVIFDKLYPEKKKGNTGGMDLADKGMGSIQIVILLLRLATLAKKYRGQSLTVLLEEPEQNLHPAMQSKLTDLLYYVNHEFGIQFIIETHSEYLIRKSQLFVAADNKSEYENKVLFKVYYLPDDDKQPYEMIYREDGKFTNEFGPGFFDTASNLAFELF